MPAPTTTRAQRDLADEGFDLGRRRLPAAGRRCPSTAPAHARRRARRAAQIRQRARPADTCRAGRVPWRGTARPAGRPARRCRVSNVPQARSEAARTCRCRNRTPCTARGRIGVARRLVLGDLKSLAGDRLDGDGRRQQVRAAAADEIHLRDSAAAPSRGTSQHGLVRLRRVQHQHRLGIDVGQRQREHVDIRRVARFDDHQILAVSRDGQRLESRDDARVLDVRAESARRTREAPHHQRKPSAAAGPTAARSAAPPSDRVRVGPRHQHGADAQQQSPAGSSAGTAASSRSVRGRSGSCRRRKRRRRDAPGSQAGSRQKRRHVDEARGR